MVYETLRRFLVPLLRGFAEVRPEGHLYRRRVLMMWIGGQSQQSHRLLASRIRLAVMPLLARPSHQP